MRVRRGIAMLVVLALVTPAAAAPRKVLVLPLDGDADAATRERLSASVQRIARVIDGAVVTDGDTTFADTAAAVGCDPTVPTCVDEVRATLGVDELVYGTANVQDGRISVVIKRASSDAEPRELTTSVSPDDPPSKTEGALLPVFSEHAAVPPPDAVADPDPLAPPEPIDTRSRRDRNLGIAAVVGGGTMFLIGLAMWSSAGGLQNDIDDARTNSRTDFDRLIELEDRASTRAWAGNLLVLGGLALGGYGGWLLYKDRKARMTLAPMPTEGGAAVTLTIIGDVL